MQPNIRPLQSTDRAVWADLWRAYLAFYNTERPDYIYDITFARNIDPDCIAQQAMVAEGETGLVGLVHYVYHPHNWQDNDVCYLQDLYTVSAARGQGVGRALIQAVYDAADAAGCPNVYWMTQEYNYAGHMLYDRIGQKTPFIKYARP